MNIAQIVRLVMAQVTPLIDVAVQRAITQAEHRRRTEGRVVPGQIVDVAGSVVEVVTDDAENGEQVVYATRTDPAQVRGERVVVMFGPKGAAYCLGPVPQE